jgi:hypothetical protein
VFCPPKPATDRKKVPKSHIATGSGRGLPAYTRAAVRRIADTVQRLPHSAENMVTAIDVVRLFFGSGKHDRDRRKKF